MSVLAPRARLMAAIVPVLALTGTGLLVQPATAAPARPTSTISDVDVVAHRGSSGAAPENTLAAVRLALRQRADVVENDIQRTADGELVIVHDTTLTRTTDVEQVFPGRAPWNVGDFTLAEIKQLDAGSWFDPAFAGERVPTLREWVEAIGGRAGMLLEPKAPALYPGIDIELDKELRSMPAFRSALMRDDVVVQSFDHEWLHGYKDLAPDVPVGLLFGTRPTSAQVTEAATWAEQVNPALGVSEQATIDQVHQAGMEIHVWTVNTGQDMRRAARWGVDGIITNYPQVLRDIVGH
ncbi:hydrolase [Nocardioides psychrotolerans]|uniref:Glycerophosphoryl diester phosphodiesterase n=1 Tax=Nocardioides psychrotolerans TaxID=1005945 RepID=A0A1I3CFW9_9ACTN|nr:glycerophosphodiester phosphodiesterase family protein [Nocardioides psychrotolerans]GEP39738.1 hydrolase [Nocardioides psychrotolerans]SFH73438.1 glycerophosphoryl diester phosphodiesterase [Nocardioides psychrotolerans]